MQNTSKKTLKCLVIRDTFHEDVILDTAVITESPLQEQMVRTVAQWQGHSIVSARAVDEDTLLYDWFYYDGSTSDRFAGLSQKQLYAKIRRQESPQLKAWFNQFNLTEFHAELEDGGTLSIYPWRVTDKLNNI